MTPLAPPEPGHCPAAAGLTLAPFRPVHTFEFFNYDGPRYVLHNDMVRQGPGGEGLRWAFTTTAVSNWHPGTWFSHMTDVQFFALHRATSSIKPLSPQGGCPSHVPGPAGHDGHALAQLGRGGSLCFPSAPRRLRGVGGGAERGAVKPA